MAQLKMYWLPGTPINEVPLPEGYSVSNFRTDADRLAWCECCKNGLVADDADESTFYDRIESDPDINIYTDVFFLDYQGEHIGTVTAFRDKERNVGDMHMVGIKTEFRGKGLAKYLNFITQKKLAAEGVKYIFLTTDEWRKGAVKSYLSGGFLPVEYDEGMEERWRAVLREYGIPQVDMLNEDGTFYKTIFSEDKTNEVNP